MRDKVVKDVICIICPQACRANVEIDSQKNILRFSGDICEKGEAYVKKEVTNPERVVTTTIMTEGSVHPLLPVRTDKPVPKEMVRKILAIIHSQKVRPPIEFKKVLIENILGTGVNIIATRGLKD